METSVLVLASLVADIRCNGLFVSMLSNRVYEVPVSPEFPSPKLFLYMGGLGKDLSGGEAFHHSNNLGWTVGWNRLDEEVDMIFVCSNLDEFQFIPFGYFKTGLFEDLVYLFIDNHTSILGGTDKMVQENRNIMALMEVLTHSPSLPENTDAASRGVFTRSE